MRIVFQLDACAPARTDVTGALRQMVQESGLPYARAKQNPHAPRLNYGPSLKKGQRAVREYADIYLLESAGAEQVRRQLERSKPQGLALLEVYRVPYTFPAVQQLATVGKFTAQGDFSAYFPRQTFENYVACAQVEVVRQAANGMTLITDIKPFVVAGRTVSPQCIEMTLTSVADKWLNPLEAVCGWLDIPLQEDVSACDFAITRQGLYWKDSAGELHLI